uniref:Collagen-like protein-4 n=1 Tax=Mytilus coruscus TaxID=42192 RepID=A0A0K2D7M3_MYTCO|nr:collagen-like protein-4 [Mytilus coruscus]
MLHIYIYLKVAAEITKFQVKTLEMMRILLAHLMCLLLAINPSLQLINTKADVLFILDTSGSIGQSNFTIMKNTAANIAGQFMIGKDNTQVGVDVFSHTVKTEIKLRQWNWLPLLRYYIKNIPYGSGGTKTYAALEHARKSSFTKPNGDRPDAQNIALVMTDGGSDNKDFTCAAAQKMRDDGILVFAIPIGSNINEDEIKCIETDSSFRFAALNFEALKLSSFRQGIARKILSASKPRTG